jgi:hypothetical protein
VSATPATRHTAARASATGPEAVADACGAAAAALNGELGLLLAFTSGAVDHHRAAKALGDAAGTAPSAGMTGKGLITDKGPLDAGCVAVAFGPQVTGSVGVARSASSDLRSAGRKAATAAIEGSPATKLILLFIDSSQGDIADTIAGAYDAAGPRVRLAGGAAGGDDKRHYHEGEATDDSVVAVALESTRPIAVASTQSCRVRGTPAIVTRSEGQRVSEIDGRPAQDIYLEQIGFAGIPLEDSEFEKIAITHPVAQPELHGDRRLRHVLGRHDDGSLLVGTHIPAGAAIEFTEAEPEELLESAAGSIEEASRILGEDDPEAALVFDCAGRRRVLGTELGREVAAIGSALGERGAPLAGLYTYGEVARLKGAKGDRNHAVVTVAFG